MIPAKFDYVRPGSLDEAVSALSGGGDDAKVIAGGQSLLPLLRMRLAYPELLVDVGGLDELRGVTDAGDSLVIGARTTHHQLVRDPLVAEHCGLLAQAAATVAAAWASSPQCAATSGSRTSWWCVVRAPMTSESPASVTPRSSSRPPMSTSSSG